MSGGIRVPEELPFVGRGRHRLVEQLLARFDEVVSAGTPMLVTLEAGTGWGKTRLVQELYRRMAATRQPQPGYWPDSILDARPAGATTAAGPDDAATFDPAAARQDRRKRIHPERFTPPEDSAPHWFWWGISATAQRGGAGVSALAQDLAQVDAHAAGLEARWRELAGVSQRVARVARGEDAAALGELLRDEGIGRATEMVLGSAVPGLGLLMWAGGVVWRQRDRWMGSSRPSGPVDASTAGSDELVSRLAASVGDLAGVGLPVVVVVEDVHEADAALVELLVQVLVASGPVLVIASGWPGLLDDPGIAAHRLLADVSSGRRDRLRQSHELLDLEEAALDDLAAALLPEATPRDRHLLTGRFTVPLTLEVACTVRNIRDAVADGDLRVADVESLPRDVEGLYREVWRQLPRAVRDRLMLAALATPRAAGSLFVDGQWDGATVAAAVATLPWIADGVERAFGPTVGDVTAYAWIRRVDAWLRSFHEPVQLDVVVGASRDGVGRRRRDEFYAALASRLDPTASDLSADRRRWHAQVLVTLASEGFLEWTEPVQDAVDLLVAEAAELPDVASAHTVVGLLTAVEPGGDADTPRELARRERLGHALLTVGRGHEAVEVLGDLHRHRVDSLGHTCEATLRTGVRLASALEEVGRRDEAIELLGDVADLARDACGPRHALTLAARNNLALAWVNEGEHDAAIPHFVELVGDVDEAEWAGSWGMFHNVRSNLALALLAAGQLQEAVWCAQSTLMMSARSRGPDHPGTLTTRVVFGQALAEAGMTNKALEQYREALAGRREVLGDDHPDTRELETLVAVSEQAATAPRDDVEIHHDWTLEDQTLLVQGRNTDGDEIFVYARIHPSRVQDLDKFMEAGGTFVPSEWGYVVSAGRGKPTPRDTAFVGIPDHMIKFHPPEDSEDSEAGESDPDGSHPNAGRSDAAGRDPSPA